jgi:CRP/FNR family transcriptional regulator
MAAPAQRTLPSQVEILQLLRRAEFFQVLSDEALTEVAARALSREYGERTLISYDAAFSRFHVILSGRMRLFLLSRDGREITLGVKHAAEVFWYALPDQFALSYHTEHTTHYAEVLENGTVLCSIPQLYVRHLMATHPPFALAFFDQMCRCSIELCDRIWELAHDQVPTRLAHTLARLARANERCVVTETHDELAWWVGTSRARVTKELHRLRDLGLIEYRPHQHGIQVVNPEYLSSL